MMTKGLIYSVKATICLFLTVSAAVGGTMQGSSSTAHSLPNLQGVYTPASPVLQASLRPSPFVWKRVNRENIGGPVLYQLLLNASGTPNTVAMFDTNPRHLTNSPITVNGSMVAIGSLSINGSGVITFAPGQNFPSSGLPPAGGDASGPLTNLTVIRLQNQPVSNTAPFAGQVLTFNGSSWSPASPSGSNGTVTSVSNSDGFLSITSPTTTPVINFNLTNTDARYAQVTALNSEVSRAQSAEATLQTNINSETSRAQSAEATKVNLTGGNSFIGDQTVAGNVSAANFNASGAITTQVPNNSSGTANTRLAKLNGASAVTAQTGDSAGALGVVVSGGGTSGNALIAIAGQASCLFDNTNTPGDYVQIGTAGQCHDTGSTSFPASGQVLGRVLTSNSGAGTASNVVLFGAEDAGFAGGTVTQVGTGAGLTGGPITATGTIAIATGGVTNAMLQNSSLTVTAGTGLSGGGAVALGSSITLNNAGVLNVTASAPLSSSGGASPNISLGTVGTVNGGTGLTSSGATGNYLRSNGASWTSSTVQAGDLPSLSGTYVDLGTNQTIGGNKTFSNLITGSITGNSATATNATQLGGVVAANYARRDVSNTFAAANTFSASQNLAAGAAITTTLPNDTVTGTIQNLLAKLNGASPSQAIRAATTDIANVAGVVISPTANTGNALIATIGQANCQFDGAATASDYVVISSTIAGNCHDVGANYPPNGVQVIGRVLSSLGGAGLAPVVLFGPGEHGPSSVLDNTGTILAGSTMPMHTVAGTANVVAGNNVIVSFAASVAFSATTSYRCTASDTSGQNNAGVTRNSASQITVLGNNGHNIDFICVGN